MKLGFRRRLHRIAVHHKCFEAELKRGDILGYFWWLAIITALASAGCIAAGAQVWSYPYPRALLIYLFVLFAAISGCCAGIHAVFHLSGAAVGRAAIARKRIYLRHAGLFALPVAFVVVVLAVLAATTVVVLQDCAITASVNGLCNVTTSDMDRDKAIEINRAFNHDTNPFLRLYEFISSSKR